MTPIESAARAACLWHVREQHPSGLDEDYASGYVNDRWEDHLPQVRAILVALRDPSAIMQDAAYAYEWGPGGDGSVADAAALNVWQAMIDAALSERPRTAEDDST